MSPTRTDAVDPTAEQGHDLAQALSDRGWARFPADPATLAWAEAARAVGCDVAADPAMQEAWLRCEGTWFVGVDALPSDAAGQIAGVPLGGAAVSALSPLPELHPAQLSVTYPGYPRPLLGESDAAYGYRLRRDAAHVDGMLPSGPERRRVIAEPHAFILGIALSAAAAEASPLVVWEGSPAIMRAALQAALAAHPQEHWSGIDVTEAYKAARRICFETCQRRPLPLAPGEAVVLHRLALHGVAPWAPGAQAAPEGRMIAYFRPQIEGGVAAWLSESGESVAQS